MKVREAITRMGTYDPPLSARTGGDQVLLDFNESTVPPAPEVIQAMVEWLQKGSVKEYPRGYEVLEEKLAAYSGVRAEQVMLTNGSDQALEVVLRALLDAGDEMVFTRPGFAMIPHIAETIGAVTVYTDYPEDMTFPLEAVLAAVTPRTRLIVLISPNNPTGTPVAQSEVVRVLEAFPQVPVLVDEAYFEFTGNTAAGLIDKYDNLVVTRTFSKAFALAGLRLGYVLSGGEFIRELHKVRGPFDVNMMAVVGATALLENQDGVRAYVSEVMERAKPMVERFFDQEGVTYFKGAANFMLVRTGNVEQATTFLREHSILVRPQKLPIADCFRLSVGREVEMQRFVEVYRAYLSTVGNGGR